MCDKLSFSELRQLIDESLSALRGRECPPGTPKDRATIATLLDMLETRMDVDDRWGAGTQDEELKAVRSEETRLEKAVVGLEKAVVLQKKRIVSLKREIRSPRMSNRARLVSRCKDEEKRFQQLCRELTARRTERADLASRLPPSVSALRTRQQIVSRLRAEFANIRLRPKATEMHFGTVSVGRVSWTLLPSGDLGTETIRAEIEATQRSTPDLQKVLDERAAAIRALPTAPIRAWVGTADFRGYIAFEFEHTSWVTLESFVYGNATYHVRGDWKQLSRLTKAELRALGSDFVRRYPHVKGPFWTWRIKPPAEHS